MTKEVTMACVPVVFTDGDRETDLGDVYVHPTTVGSKHLQALIAEKIGVSPHQISLSVLAGDPAVPAAVARKISLGSIFREKSCYLLATLNRSSSRRARRRGRNSPEKHAAPEKVLLRRDPAAAGLPEYGRLSTPPPQHPQAALGLMEHDTLVELRRLFQMKYAAAAGSLPSPLPRPAAYEAAPAAAGEGKAVCEACEAWEEEEAPPPFHLCVYDSVTVAFRTRAGPIQRPNRGRAG